MYRWKLAIQRYAFNIRHVVGELNVVADAFSRCVFDNHSTKAYPVQAVATMNEIVLTDEQYTTIGQFHNSTAGHAGIDRTVKRMHKRGISWPYLRELVRAYIRTHVPNLSEDELFEGSNYCSKIYYYRRGTDGGA